MANVDDRKTHEQLEHETDDELYNLFSSFDEVSASDELKNATLAHILAMSEDAAVDDADEASFNSDEAAASASERTSPENERPAELSPLMTAVEGGKKRGVSARRTKWRAIRIAAIAACLALALCGGVAYATPASFYDVIQNDSKVTLGVNCFGITISATSDDEMGKEIVDSTDLRNIPYQEAISRAIEQMEEREPAQPIEYGPQDGEHDTIQPEADNRGEDANIRTREGARPDNTESPDFEHPEANRENDPGNPGENQIPEEPQDTRQPQGEPSNPDGQRNENHN